MARTEGFPRGDLDTSFPLDDKFVALRGSVDALTYYAAAGVYFHVVAATWREAERKTAARVSPDAEQLIRELVRVGLLDNEQCVPKRAFSHSVARARRNRRAAAERQAKYRAQKSRSVTRDSASQTGSSIGRARSVGTVGKVGTENRAEAGAGHSNGTTPDPYDEVVQWLASKKAWVDSPRIQTDLARMVDKKDAATVIAAMAAVPDAEDAAQFVYGARNALFPLSGSRVTKPPTPAEQERAEGERQLAEMTARRTGR